MARIEFADLASLSACVAVLTPGQRERLAAEAAPTHALLVPDDMVEIVEAAMASADPVEQARAALIAYAADKRWQIEVGGISIGGIDVATDDRSKTMIMGARIKADSNPAFSTRWKTQAGFAVLTAGEIIAISDAVLAHVDACFTAEATVLAAIEAGTITTSAEIDAAGWPG